MEAKTPHVLHARRWLVVLASFVAAVALALPAEAHTGDVYGWGG